MRRRPDRVGAPFCFYPEGDECNSASQCRILITPTGSAPWPGQGVQCKRAARTLICGNGIHVFVDEAKIYLKAGDGGDGCVAFRREKFVPRGGPSGGDGGHGGSVYAVADPSFTTLYHLRHQNFFRGRKGEHGMGSNCHGRTAEDILVPLPLGSVVVDADTGELVADLLKAGEKVLLAAGGNGGGGEAH